MSRRNNDAITIQYFVAIEDNGIALSLVSERSGYSKWHLQRMFKKETVIPWPVHPQPQADGDCAEAQAEQ